MSFDTLSPIWLPSALLFFTALSVISVDLVNPAGKKSLWFAVSLLGSGLSLLAQIDNFSSETVSLFGGMFILDPLAQVSSIVILAIAFLTVFISYPYIEEQGVHCSEYYALLLLGSLGMLWMVSSKDLLTIFIAL